MHDIIMQFNNSSSSYKNHEYAEFTLLQYKWWLWFPWFLRCPWFSLVPIVPLQPDFSFATQIHAY